MKTDYSKVAPTAFFQAYYRTFYDIPYAKEIAEEIHAKEKFEEFLGVDANDRLRLAPVFEARYKGTDQAIHDYLRKTNTHQIIELASGLSPQGMIYTEKYPNLTYVETDLEDLIKIKKEIVSKILPLLNNRLSFEVANILESEELNKVVSKLDGSSVLIFNIGFLSYLGLKEKEILCRNIHEILSKFGGVWITPDPAMHNERRGEMSKDSPAQKRLENKITKTTGQSYDDNSFVDEAETDKFFLSQGFNIEKYSPAGGYDLVSPEKANLSEKDKKYMTDHVNKYAKVWIMSVK